MKKQMMILTLLITSLTGSIGAAQFSIGPQVGYFKAMDADNGSFMAGALARIKLHSVLGLEGAVNYRQETYGNEAVAVRTWPVMVTGLLYPMPILYAGMGVGWYNVTYDYKNSLYPLLKDDTQQEFGWHFAGGVEIPSGKRINLVGDIRYIFLDYNFEEIPGSNDIDSDFFVLGLGILFKL